ncbi:MAG: DNA internalization-related competence protein ComEC/Rec2, partial [Halanaerobiaceae bacterium]
YPVKYGLIQLDKRYFDIQLSEGDKIKTSISLKTPLPALNPGQFSYRSYLRRKGVYSLGYIEGRPQILSSENRYWKINLIKLKRHLIENINKSLNKTDREIIKALILGERTNLPDKWQEEFSHAGASHLLAISGLHVGFIALILIGILKMARFDNLLGKIFISLILIFYIILTGGRPSVIRAGIFAVLFLWASSFQRKGDILNISGLTIVINLLINPRALFNIGFQLTYLVLYAIIFWAERIKKSILLLPGVSLAAQVGSFPVSAYYFNLVTPVGIITNLWAIPLAAVIILFSVVSLFFSLFSPIYLQAVSPVLHLLLEILFLGMKLMNRLPLGWVEVKTPQITTVIFWYLMILGLPFFLFNRLITESKKKKEKLWYMYLTILMILLLLSGSNFDDLALEMVFLSVGQGDSIFIQLPDKKTILIDGGGRIGENSDMGEQVVLPFLQHKGIRKLDLVMVSHFDDDHARGIISILQNREVGALLVPQVFAENHLAKRIINLAAENEIPVFYGSRDDFIQMGNVNFNILHPDPDDSAGNNNYNSLVMKLEYGSFSALLTGDLGKLGEYELAGLYNLQSSILKLGHHGSDTSSTSIFLDRVAPGEAIISVGDNNYGHPSPSVLQRIKKRNIRTWRTDKAGAIFITSKGDNYQIDSYIND